MSIPVCEAMLVGTPVVSSYVGGIPSLLSHRESGLLYPETETEMLSFLLGELFEDGALCRALSRNAVRRGGELVSREAAVDALMGCYRQMSEGDTAGDQGFWEESCGWRTTDRRRRRF